MRRAPERGVYGTDAIHAILDEALVCHVGFVPDPDDGQPYVIPTIHGRDGDTLYLHGSTASRMLRALADEIPLCVTVTLVDALVLARSAFHQTLNYRSAVILGRAARVTDEDEKLRALRVISERVLPGRWADCRPPTAGELRQTTVLSVAISEASAKMRDGHAGDPPADVTLAHWAGIIPLHTQVGGAQPAPDLHVGTAVPDYVPAGSLPRRI